MTIVKLYLVGQCKECDHVKMMLDELSVEYIELDVTQDPYREDVVRMTGCFSVPQLLLDDVYIGNYDDVVQLFKTEKLKAALT